MYPHSKNKCCLSGLRAVLGYLKSQNASNIRIETITQQPAGNNVSMLNFILMQQMPPLLH